MNDVNSTAHEEAEQALNIIQNELAIFTPAINPQNIMGSASEMASEIDNVLLNMQQDIVCYQQDLACIVEHLNGNKEVSVESIVIPPTKSFYADIDGILEQIDALYAAAHGVDKVTPEKMDAAVEQAAVEAAEKNGKSEGLDNKAEKDER